LILLKQLSIDVKDVGILESGKHLEQDVNVARPFANNTGYTLRVQLSSCSSVMVLLMYTLDIRTRDDEGEMCRDGPETQVAIIVAENRRESNDRKSYRFCKTQEQPQIVASGIHWGGLNDEEGRMGGRRRGLYTEDSQEERNNVFCTLFLRITNFLFCYTGRTEWMPTAEWGSER
jgi:hypothetical protein